MLLAFVARLLYCFAIAFTQMTRGSQCGEQYFPNIPVAMQSLFISGALLDDVGTVLKDLFAERLILVAILPLGRYCVEALGCVSMVVTAEAADLPHIKAWVRKTVIHGIVVWRGRKAQRVKVTK